MFISATINDFPPRRLHSPDEVTWWLVITKLGKQWCCLMAYQLWLLMHTQEEEEKEEAWDDKTLALVTDLLMFDAAYVCSICVSASTCNITQLTMQLHGACMRHCCCWRRCWIRCWRRRHLQWGLLLLVPLTLQVFLVRLHTTCKRLNTTLLYNSLPALSNSTVTHRNHILWQTQQVKMHWALFKIKV